MRERLLFSLLLMDSSFNFVCAFDGTQSATTSLLALFLFGCEIGRQQFLRLPCLQRNTPSNSIKKISLDYYLRQNENTKPMKAQLEANRYTVWKKLMSQAKIKSQKIFSLFNFSFGSFEPVMN